MDFGAATTRRASRGWKTEALILSHEGRSTAGHHARSSMRLITIRCTSLVPS